jgi:5-methylcytosine-specific restriction endonuclease McrA
MKRSPINRVSKRRRQRDRDYPAQRMEVWSRADGLCEATEDPDTDLLCGEEGTEVHHRAGRGGVDPHRLDNLLLLCKWHHDEVHANPAKSYLNGMMVRRNTGDFDDVA